MLTLLQFKKMSPPQAGARLMASRAKCMAEFNKKIVYELSLPAPVTMNWRLIIIPYEHYTHAGRVWYWAKQRRNLARKWRKYLSDLAAEGRVV